jgi:hypothetical protein
VYQLTANLTSGGPEACELAWAGLGISDRADVVRALGAQARLAALLAQTGQATPFCVPASYWDRISCDHIRAFAVDAWTGTKAAVLPRHPCGYCLRIAAEALAELRLTALAATGLARQRLAEPCGQVTT